MEIDWTSYHEMLARHERERLEARERRYAHLSPEAKAEAIRKERIQELEDDLDPNYCNSAEEEDAICAELHELRKPDRRRELPREIQGLRNQIASLEVTLNRLLKEQDELG